MNTANNTVLDPDQVNRYGERICGEGPRFCQDVRCDIGDCPLAHSRRHIEHAEARQQAAEDEGWS